MSSADDRDAALSEFERTRLDFEESVRRAPDAALRFRPAGEDYALGGLVVHVTDVLINYRRVVDAIHASDWQEPIAHVHETSPDEARLIHEGFAGGERGRVLDEMRAAHAALIEAMRSEPAAWFTRQAPVVYSGSAEPYPTSPADVLGWVRDHYMEHTQQIGNLVTDWAAATR